MLRVTLRNHREVTDHDCVLVTRNVIVVIELTRESGFPIAISA